MNDIVREGEAPAEPQEPSDVPRTHGSAGVSPSLSQQTAKVEGLPPVEPRIALEPYLESRALSANHLLTDLQDRALENRLNRMSLNARTALSERGVNVLFVAFDFLKWFEAEHSEEPRLSPLLLVPVCLERIGATASWMLSLDEDEPFLSPLPRPVFRNEHWGERGLLLSCHTSRSRR